MQGPNKRFLPGSKPSLSIDGEGCGKVDLRKTIRVLCISLVALGPGLRLAHLSHLLRLHALGSDEHEVIRYQSRGST